MPRLHYKTMNGNTAKIKIVLHRTRIHDCAISPPDPAKRGDIGIDAHIITPAFKIDVQLRQKILIQNAFPDPHDSASYLHFLKDAPACAWHIRPNDAALRPIAAITDALELIHISFSHSFSTPLSIIIENPSSYVILHPNVLSR